MISGRLVIEALAEMNEGLLPRGQIWWFAERKQTTDEEAADFDSDAILCGKVAEWSNAADSLSKR